jgi:hypothetical protein
MATTAGFTKNVMRFTAIVAGLMANVMRFTATITTLVAIERMDTTIALHVREFVPVIFA